MGLNELGVVAYKCWEEMPKHFPNALLDEFVIMPNHVHGIIVIENPSNPVLTRHGVLTNISTPVETRHGASLPNADTFGPLKTKSIPSIINHYKGSVKRTANKIGFYDFAWQPSYYDHIIESEESLNRIRGYIRFNPEKWEIDRNNPTNL